MSKVALITGVTGQDGSYWQSFCWKKVTRCMVLSVVHRIQHRARGSHLSGSAHLQPEIHLHYGDLSDTSNLTRILREYSRMKCTTWGQ